MSNLIKFFAYGFIAFAKNNLFAMLSTHKILQWRNTKYLKSLLKFL